MPEKKIKIFVVNLKSSTERRKAMEQQLQKYQLPFEIFDAVKGTALAEKEILQYFDKEYYDSRPFYYTAGMIGCTLSHYFLYQKIVKEKVDIALILEDDMALGKELPQVLDKLATSLRCDEVILLFYQSYFKINLAASSAEPLQDSYKLYQVADIKGLRSTGGYIISHNAAKSFVEQLLPVTTFPDEWKLFYDRKILNGIRIVYPPLLQNTCQPTTISPNMKGGSFLKIILAFIEKHRIFPVYQLLKWRRRLNIMNTQKCVIKEIKVTDFRK